MRMFFGKTILGIKIILLSLNRRSFALRNTRDLNFILSHAQFVLIEPNEEAVACWRMRTSLMTS